MMNNSQSVPLADLRKQYSDLKEDIDGAIAECITEAGFIRGKAVSEFENAFSRYLGTEYCISCGNGTDAIEIILKSLGIGPGDEVIVPALSWFATAEAVNNTGAEPVFVDINKHNYTIDTSQIEDKITRKTKAIIPVHLYGSPAGMSELTDIADRRRLFIVEDCAQSHGAEYNGRKTGTFGIASAFSFFPSKNLGAFGDGGAIVTNDLKVANTARMICNHGMMNTRHKHLLIGRNSRLDTIQAAILNVKLPHLDDWNAKRIKAANHYRSILGEIDSLILPGVEKEKKHVFHLFVIRTMMRESLMATLTENKISCSVHYPTPMPFLDAYSYKNHKKTDFPVAAQVSKEILSLPMFPEITREQIETVCTQIKKSI